MSDGTAKGDWGGWRLALLWLVAWGLIATGLYGWLGWPVVPLSAGLLLLAWAVLATVASAAVSPPQSSRKRGIEEENAS